MNDDSSLALLGLLLAPLIGFAIFLALVLAVFDRLLS